MKRYEKMIKRNFDPLEIKARYPQIPLLDIHYYGLKGYGIDYENQEEGRPKFHIRDETYLFSVVPLMADQDSPYVYREDLTFNGKPLPFKVQFIKRVKGSPSYFYYRDPREWIQTIDSKIVLTTNFQQSCKGCDFCCREDQGRMENITPREGMGLIITAGEDFHDIDELAIVTGMFKDEDSAIQHISEISSIAVDHGFKGHLFYISSQIKTKQGVRRLVHDVGGVPIRYAYTLETFTKREKMHPIKNRSLEEALEALKIIREEGIERLEYTYMPGIDSLKSFYENAPKFAGRAKPHVSIYRPATTEQKKDLLSEDFIQDPVDYLCKMRLELEALHNGPIYGNNLGNLWLFPINRINPIFLTDKTHA